MKLATENEFIRGSIAGSLSAVVICLLFEVLEKFNLIKNCWLFLAGQSVMNFSHNFLLGSFAFLIHLGVGTFWGIIIAFVFSKMFSDKYSILKGFVIGFVIFFLHIGILANMFHYPQELREHPLTVFFIFLSYLIYGALTSFVLKKLP